jgi:hypothetical protein
MVRKDELKRIQISVRTQGKRVEDIKKALLSVFEHYQKNPRWDLLQSMFRLCFELGYETKAYSYLESHEMSIKEDAKA